MKKLFVTIAVICWGIGSAWGQSWDSNIAHIFPELTNNGDSYGYSVKISGNSAVLSSTNKDYDGYLNVGEVIVLEKNADTWVEVSVLRPPQPISNLGFGTSIDIDNDVIVIGARQGHPNFINSGSAYVYRKNESGSWEFEQHLIPSAFRNSNNLSDTPVGVSQGFIAIGADGNSDFGANYNNGAVYIFEYSSNGVWEPTQTLFSSDVSAGDQFGYSLSIKEDLLLVGASREYGIEINSGAAYLFKKTNGLWEEEAKLIGSSGSSSDYFGASTGISGEYLAVGAMYHEGDGSVFLYKKNSNENWEEIQKLKTGTLQASTWFGRSIDLDQSKLVVGAPFYDGTASNSGAVFVFSIENGNFSLKSTIAPSNLGSDAEFGYSTSISENYIIAGCYALNNNNGASYLFNPIFPDLDNDNITSDVDCNDNDPNIGLPPTWYADVDGDGFGDPNSTPIESCDQPIVNNVTYVLDNTDCDEGNNTIYPGAPELTDGLDNDCDPSTEDRWAEIPDPNFRAYLEQNFASAMFDVDSDGVTEMDITNQVILQATTLFPYTQGITDFTGVEYFVNLTAFGCDQNEFTTLPSLNSLTKLEVLSISSPNLVSLPPLSALVNLKQLYIRYSPIESLPDLSSLVNLEVLSCEGNQLTTLPSLSNLQKLKELNCQNNQLNALPTLTGLSSLQSIWCYGNKLTTLPDLSGLTNLLGIQAYQNYISSVSAWDNLPSFYFLSLGNNELTELPDLSNLVALTDFEASNNTALSKINGQLPNSISLFWIENTQITCLPNIPTSLTQANTQPQSVYQVCSTAPPALTLPTNFSSPQQSFTTIDLSWTDASEAEMGYRVLRSMDGVNFMEVAVLDANVSNYQDAFLDPSTTYYYQLQVFNDTESLTTEAIQVATQEAPCITFPYGENFDGQSVYPQGWSSVSSNNFDWQIFAPEVSPWEGNVAFIEGDFSTPFDAWLFSPQLFLKQGFTYTITFEYSGGGQVSFRQYQDQLAFAYGTGFTPADMTTVVFDNQFIQTSPMEVSHTITPTESNVYHLGWHAKSAKGFAITIDKLNITAEAPEPAVPLNLVATPQSATEIEVVWEYPTDAIPAGGFQLRRAKDEAFTEEITDYDLPFVQRNYTDSNLDAGTSYFYKVRSKALSASVSAIPPAVTNVSATAGDQSATVSFTETGADNYIVKVYSDGNEVAINASGSASPITINGLDPGVSYSFSVVSANNCGDGIESSLSNEVTPFDLSSGLIAYFPFNGNANDESGNGNNGTVNGATLTTDRNGNANAAYSFDGVDDYIDLPDLLNGGDFTLSLLVFPQNQFSYTEGQNTNITQKVISNLINGASFPNGIELGYGKDGTFSSINGVDAMGGSISGILPINNWYQVVLSYNSSDQILKGFINGAFQIERMQVYIDNGAILRVGARANSIPVFHFQGMVDDIRIYNRSLTETETQQLYQE